MGNGTSIGRVRGLGSAKSGTHHWIVQRFTAVGNLLLVLWFMVSLLHLSGLDHDSVVGWLKQPLAAVPMMLMLANVFWHLRLGLQIVIEDSLPTRSSTTPMTPSSSAPAARACAPRWAAPKPA
jgi:succinate dehydrogenase / fumarate reductase membrane anchor subunit